MTPRRSLSTRRRLRIFQAGNGICVLCGEKIDGTREAWTVEHLLALALGGEDTDDNCGPAHERCRRQKDRADVGMIRKADRQAARYTGAKAPSRNPLPFGRGSKFKRKLDGSVVPR